VYFFYVNAKRVVGGPNMQNLSEAEEKKVGKVAHGKRKGKPTLGTETVNAVIATAHAGGVTSDRAKSSVMR